MTLEKHVIDTIKEWQMKIGSLDSDIRLYYPKASLCHYLNLSININHAELSKCIEDYFENKVKYLGKVTVTAKQDRFCILVGKQGCEYVEKKVPEPEFLVKFLEILKCQNMQKISDFFEEYAKRQGTSVCTQKEEDAGMIFYFKDEYIEPYVYCIDQNEFGITYHRFTKEDYMEL